MRPNRKHISQTGFVLVLVLWFLTLISVIALHLSQMTRSDAQLANNLVMAARLSHANDAGVSWALWNLGRPPEARWLADGAQQYLDLGDTQVLVSLQDEYGKLDINQIDSPRLINLFQSVGVSDGLSVLLADAILDWRDADSLRRLNGAEDQDYQLDGRSYGAADEPFESIAELRKILGMEEWIYQRIRPAVTVYAGRDAVNPLVAPRTVLMSFPNADPSAVDLYIRDRRNNHLAGLPPPPTPAFVDNPLPLRFQGVYYTLSVDARVNDQHSLEEAIVRRRGGAQGRHDLIKFQVPVLSYACAAKQESLSDVC